MWHQAADWVCDEEGCGLAGFAARRAICLPYLPMCSQHNLQPHAWLINVKRNNILLQRANKSCT